MLAHDIDKLYTMVTPKLAEEILNHNTFNRALRPGKVEQIARDIMAGLWKKNGATVVIAKDNVLLDGQHRLFAVIESDTPVPMIVVRNADKDVLPTIDTGISRNYSDYRKLSAKGNGETFSYPNELSAALRLVQWYDTRWPAFPSGRGKGLPSHQELDAFLELHPGLPDRVAEVAAFSKLKKLGSAMTTAFVYAMAHQSHPEQAEQWLQILKTGDAPINHPANVLREKLIGRQLSGKKLDTPTRLVFLIKSWNAFAQGKQIASIRWLPEEPIPAIFGTGQYTGARAGHTARAERVERVRKVSGKASSVGKRRKGKRS